ncbi:MAG TPA: Hpt domain-containing protein [Gemmataceae bacterium]|nr:Hpt domain-containing protein [Gemmataceae bacterium]
MSRKSAPDPALLDLFRAEIDVHLPALSEGLLALEKDPNQPKRLEALMRAAHSIKGAARIVGVDAAVQVAHSLEDYFVAAQKGAVTLSSDAVDVLLRGVDALVKIAPAGGGPTAGAPTEETLRPLLDDIAALRTARPAPRAPVAVVETGPSTVRAAGDLEGAEAEAFRVRLAEALGKGAPIVRLDFGAVGEIGPDGLAVLALAARAASGRRPPITFQTMNAVAAIRTLLRLTRLDQTFPAADEGR